MVAVKKILLFFLFIFLFAGQSFSQFDEGKLSYSIGLGTSQYMGELCPKNFPFLFHSSAALTGGVKYELMPQLRARLGLTLTSLNGDDKYSSRADIKERNLNFKTSIWDVGLMAEYDFVDKDVYNIVPYCAIGIGIFHFNPYTYDSAVGKVYLRDIGTEGQYLESGGYPKPYSKTQFNIPIVLGIKYQISETVDLGFEMYYRKLFTDYLDDVSSSSYVDRNLFLTSPYYVSHGIDQLAYRLSYRAPAGSDYSPTLARGNPNRKDAFYTFQITATFRLGDGYSKSSPFSGRNRGYGY